MSFVEYEYQIRLSRSPTSGKIPQTIRTTATGESSRIIAVSESAVAARILMMPRTLKVGSEQIVSRQAGSPKKPHSLALERQEAALDRGNEGVLTKPKCAGLPAVFGHVREERANRRDRAAAVRLIRNLNATSSVPTCTFVSSRMRPRRLGPIIADGRANWMSRKRRRDPRRPRGWLQAVDIHARSSSRVVEYDSSSCPASRVQRHRLSRRP